MIPENARRLPWKGLPDFVGITAGNSTDDWVYRGQAKDSWPLGPKAGRPEFKRNLSQQHVPQNALFDDDLRFFVRWRELAIAYTDKLPVYDLECLAYAQHYGLATRLLDWTRNPLVALYFAVDSQEDADGVVYGYSAGTKPELTRDHNLSERVVGIRLYRPRPFDRRLLAQQGVFTYHPDPSAEFPVHQEKYFNVLEGLLPGATSSESFSDLIAIVVPKSEKFALMQRLRHLGISRNTLFPDLDGLSDAMNWEARREVHKTEMLRYLWQNSFVEPKTNPTD